ncbi:MAG TPA: alanine racemase [Gemmatimonadota bacterium]|nr:alanine racemase [Gemmatimonadota bacterium]
MRPVPDEALDPAALDATARTWVDVDLNRIRANLRAMAAMLPEATGILMPVKANAYGHGLVPVSRAARAGGAWGLGIAALDEAEALRAAAVPGPIVCLMPILPSEADRAVRLEVTPAITDWAQAEALAAAACAAGREVPVHVEIDTGMGRAGVWDREAAHLLQRIDELQGLTLEGMFTHFASADESERSYTEVQLDRFDALLRALAERGIRPPCLHVANSAAALRFRGASRTLVRPGIALYGSVEEIARDTDHGTFEGGGGRGAEFDAEFDAEGFAPSLSWHARVVAIKDLRPGDPVSYHRRYHASGAERIALLGVGYGDGWPFALSNRGRVLLRGRPVPIRGAVCMDLTMVDATPFPDLQVGEVATLIGEQDGRSQSVAEVGRAAGLMSYAVLTGISERVRRRYRGGGKDRGGAHDLGGASRSGGKTR